MKTFELFDSKHEKVVSSSGVYSSPVMTVTRVSCEKGFCGSGLTEGTSSHDGFGIQDNYGGGFWEE